MLLKCVKKSGNNKQNRSHNKFSSFTGTRRVHMVTNDVKVHGTVDLDTAMKDLRMSPMSS